MLLREGAGVVKDMFWILSRLVAQGRGMFTAKSYSYRERERKKERALFSSGQPGFAVCGHCGPSSLRVNEGSATRPECRSSIHDRDPVESTILEFMIHKLRRERDRTRVRGCRQRPRARMPCIACETVLRALLLLQS